MPCLPRPRWPGARRTGTAALTVALLLMVAACAEYPNSVFHNRTEFNRDSGWLFWLIIWVGLVVFVFVEALLVYVIIKYRAKPGQKEPEHVHGNTTLEIAWTVIPALILLVIAVPTVKSIFRTQAPAGADALQIEVVGHQWWWEFRYPQYGFTTANEVYFPLGRKVNFKLESADVIHSFWIPAMGGKRDLMKNHTNYLWFTPDSTTAGAWNGMCVEYCGTSHANMRFRAFTVTPADFESWVAHQKSPAKVLNAPPAPPPAAGGTKGQPSPVPAAATTAAMAPQPPVTQAGFISFPLDQIPAHAKATTPMPTTIPVNESLTGDPAQGERIFKTKAACFACHNVSGGLKGGNTAPDLTHVGSRTSIGAGLYPNDTKHLTAWISNAAAMKHGIYQMPTFLKGQVHPVSKQAGTLEAQEIAHLVAYLQSLK